MGERGASWSRSVTRVLWIMRATWGVTIAVCLSFVAPPLLWAVGAPKDLRNTPCMSELGPSGIWCAADTLPWGSYLEATILVVASMALPTAIHRRSIARLRRRALLEIDPSRPTAYRAAPGTRARLPNPGPALASAAARYASTLALSFALVAPLPLLAEPLLHWVGPFPSSCMAIKPCYRHPAVRTPLFLLAVFVLAIQFPTRRRALRCIEDL